MSYNTYLDSFLDNVLQSGVEGLLYEYYSTLIQYSHKYGKKTCLLHQNGSFYEAYCFTDKNGITYGNADKVCTILNMSLGHKDSKRPQNAKNPRMMGFPIYVLSKHLDVLINNNYTVVIFDQIKDPKQSNNVRKKDIKYIRKLNRVVSQSTHIQDDNLVRTNKNNNLMNIYIEGLNKNTFNCGISIIDLSIGQSWVTEIYYNKKDNKQIMDEIYRCVKCYNPVELQVIYGGIEDVKKLKLEKFLELENVEIFYESLNTKLTNINYQNELLKKVFPDCGILSPIEYIGLGRNQLACTAFICVLDFAYQHSELIIKRISPPKFIERNEQLTLENNAIKQLDIITHHTPTNLLKILNKTSTAIGHRLLRDRLIQPTTDIDELNRRYSLVDKISKIDSFRDIDRELKKIIDLERLHRRITLGIVRPYELHRLHQAYKNVKMLIKLIHSTSLKEMLPANKHIRQFVSFIKEYQAKIDMSILDNFTLDNVGRVSGQIEEDKCYTFIKPKIDKDIDKYQKTIIETKKKLDKICKELSKIIDDNSSIKNTYLKIHNYTSVRATLTDKSGLHLLTSKGRYKVLEKILKERKSSYMDPNSQSCIKSQIQSNNVKITSQEINEYSRILLDCETKLKDKTREVFYNSLSTLDSKYNNILKIITHFVAELDVICCTHKVSLANNYCRPQIVKDKEYSWINAKALRNPICEKLIDTIYIPNDITIGGNGVLLYGVNYVGKSALLKAVCLSAIMAQAGFYVPASSFSFYPYQNIFTRLPGTDNIFMGYSSFICELMDLKSILTRSNENTLCILDEITCSTEQISGISISAATIQELAKRKTSFLFATHYHKLKDLDEIKNLENVKIYHLEVKIDNKTGDLIYNRTLKKGPSDELYGIIVSKSIIQDREFQKSANNIKRKLLKIGENIIDPKKSHFNSELIMHECELCASKKNLEAHHINMQCVSNDKGMIEHFHKNNIGNLVTLCWFCHHRLVHSKDEKIIIHGWKHSVERGRFLDYTIKNDKIKKELETRLNKNLKG